ncbi:MAG TPA: DUF2917 domain-containing protein [Anaeromyxobacter sp.]|nr:DUF2917 domain-containing protein [Anaeromyxobacter sp.]
MRIDLTPSQTWSHEVGHGGVEVRIVAGEVWLTRERDPDDHVLAAPAVLESGMQGRMVVLALTAAQLEVAPLTRSIPMSGDQPAHAA